MFYLADFYALLTSLILPVGLAIWLCIKNSALLSRVGYGCAMYIIIELILKLPILSFLMSQSAVHDFLENYPVFYALLLALMQAVFEVFLTWACFRFFFGFRDTKEDAFAYAIGFAGSQALFNVGIAAAAGLSANNSFSASAMFLSGTEQLSMQLMTAVFCFMVLKSAVEKSRKWFALSLLLIFIVQFVSYTALSVLNISGWVYELILLTAAVLLFFPYWKTVRSFFIKTKS